MSESAILNRQLVALSDAKISVMDRGFMFGDGAYEVVRVYGGKPFLFDEHLTRFRLSLDELRITGVDLEALKADAIRLLAHTGEKEATIYWQVTRGAPATRSHTFPVAKPASGSLFEDAFPHPSTPPTEFIYVSAFEDKTREQRRTGGTAITFPDLRWGRCDIKSLNLLGNVFAAQAAKEAGAYDAVLVKPGGAVTEGSHTSVFAVVGGKLCTVPKGPSILPGITRDLVLRLARQLSIPTEERALRLSEIQAAEELFFSGTTTEILPMVKLDGRPVGSGAPGEIAIRLQEAFRAAVQST